jgi:hypothetical protein
MLMPAHFLESEAQAGAAERYVRANYIGRISVGNH